jgi:diguanylate cyclase (GGDEF)-like protein
MALSAAILYWVIVAVWTCVLGCAIFYSFGRRVIFGSARLLLIVVAIDTLRDIVENVYFGVYFGSQYGFFDKAIAPVLGQPILLMLPKLANVMAGCAVLFILLLHWFPRAARERNTLGTLATVDGLTGLTNRRHFLTLAECEFDRARRYQRPLAVLMIDIDHFKVINDNHGHDVGDIVIAELAKVCHRVSRETDVPARLGGEEFGILLPETPADNAVAFAERLCREVKNIAVPAGDDVLTITVSVGISEISTEMSFAELLKHADMALYDAKRAGRDRVCQHVLVSATVA